MPLYGIINLTFSRVGKSQRNLQALEKRDTLDKEYVRTCMQAGRQLVQWRWKRISQYGDDMRKR